MSLEMKWNSNRLQCAACRSDAFSQTGKRLRLWFNRKLQSLTQEDICYMRDHKQQTVNNYLTPQPPSLRGVCICVDLHVCVCVCSAMTARTTDKRQRISMAACATINYYLPEIRGHYQVNLTAKSVDCKIV